MRYTSRDEGGAGRHLAPGKVFQSGVPNTWVQ